MRILLCGFVTCLLLGVVAAEVLPVTVPGTSYLFEQRSAQLLAVLFAGLWLVESALGVVTRRRAAHQAAQQARTAQRVSGEHEAMVREQQVQISALTAQLQDREQVAGRAARQAEGREVDLREQLDALRRAYQELQTRSEQQQLKQQLAGREFMHILSRLQEKGRFIDFIMEEIGSYSDQQVGTAARYVHAGCRAVVREYLDLAPLHQGAEGAAVTVPKPAPAAELQFLGRSAVNFPVTGRLVHRGWRVVAARLPEFGAPHGVGANGSGDHGGDAAGLSVLAPAQVELL
jgi:hypothetical protein